MKYIRVAFDVIAVTLVIMIVQGGAMSSMLLGVFHGLFGGKDRVVMPFELDD